MARTMSFSIAGRVFGVEPAKIDRRRLYGWSEVHAFDDDGNECTLVATDSSGTVIIPKDSIAMGLIDQDGRWVRRDQLKTVRLDGDDAELVESSYNRVNQLETASTRELLDCSVTSFYHLKDADTELIDAIGEDIYRFDYCYLKSYETSPGFLLVCEVDGNKELFMFIGTANHFEFIGLDELAVADEIDDDDGDGDIDFSMF